MDPAVTIVLPVHNVERTLRSVVTGILELGAAPARRLILAIVDDGSTDETYETASELARDYPQVCVFRQAFRRGLGPALEQVRQRLCVSEAIVHDGVGPIDMAELATLLGATKHEAVTASGTVGEGRGSRRFAAVAALNARMAEAHRSVTTFHWLKLPEAERPRRRTPAYLPVEVQRGVVPLTTLPTIGLGGLPAWSS